MAKEKVDFGIPLQTRLFTCSQRLISVRNTIFSVSVMVSSAQQSVPGGIIRPVVSPRGIIRPVVSASSLDVAYQIFFFRNLQFLNHTIIIKTKVLLPQPQVTFAAQPLVTFAAQPQVTFADYGIPVQVPWLPCFQRLLRRV